MAEHTTGLIAAPLTGYRPDGGVNLDVPDDYASMLHANGLVGAFVNGTTGEGLSLTLDERRGLAERWVASAPEGFKVIVHVGCACQTDSKTLAAHAAEIGAAGVGEIGPVFYRPDTVDALAGYIAETAAAAGDLPYYYYHMPSMNQVEFPMIRLLERVGGIPNFAGIKYTFEDLDDYQRCVEFAGGEYDILFGRDELLLEALKRGARGGVGSTYNFMAPIYHELIAAFNAGDIAGAQKMQDLSIAGIKCLVDTGAFFSAAKAVMRAVGLDAGAVRRPLANLDSGAEAKLFDALKDAGVWGRLNVMESRDA